MSVTLDGIKHGDRIRVTIEGEALGPVDDLVRLKADVAYGERGHILNVSRPGVVSVEKVEPPIEHYGPGDVIRHKRNGATYAIGNNGVLTCLPSGNVLDNIPHWYKDHAKSDTYERVTLA